MAIDLGKFVARFVEEARDHLGRLDAGLAALDAGRSDPEGVNEVFRSAHTVKGSARMLRLAPITETAHRLEDVLGGLRDGRLSYSPGLGQLLHRGVDSLSGLVDRLADTRDGATLPAPDEALCAALAQAAGSAPAASPPAPAAGLPAVPAVPAAAGVSAAVPPEPGSRPEPAFRAAETVRVRLEKLAALIKLAGEVVSSHARMRQRLVDARAVERDLAETAGTADRGRIHGFVAALKEDVEAQETLMEELYDQTLRMRMLPLSTVFEPAARLVRELARSVGKELECPVHGAEIELDRQMIDVLSDPIVHLIRNAIDHGIEDPGKRTAAGKPAQGRLALSARQDGGSVVIEVSDDGGGIPLAAVREKAVKRGLLTREKAEALTDSEAVDLVFQPGFSTSPVITDLSGRGVGLDVVKRRVLDDLQGAVTVETRPGAGTTFSLRLPLSLAVMRILLVQARGLPFAFPAQHVAEVVEVPPEAVVTVAEREATVLRNELVPVAELADLLGIPGRFTLARPPGPARSGILLVVLRVRAVKLAVRVEALLDERDLVIKPLPLHLRSLSLVSGMVTGGRNELVGVLHAPALLEAARRARGGTPRAEAATRGEARPRHILVVDDSLSTREIERDVLEAHGYLVTLAEDGLDGLAKATEGEFDAVLTDVEMPGLDGFSLTARLRQDEKYRDRPIIIVTSRATEEDKRRGVQAGADAYVVKSDFAPDSLMETLRALLG